MLATNLFDDLSHLYDMEDALLETTLQSYIDRKKVSKVKEDSTKRRKFRQRKSWSRFQYNLTDRQFRCYFRMTRACFEYLCSRIEANVGEHEFKSEAYLRKYHSSNAGNDLKSANILHAHEQSTGGFISGEIKVALTLRILAGGSYLDLALLFETGQTYVHEIFHNVIKNWILDDRLVNINGLDYLSDEEMMAEVARQFAVGSGGIICGCIGALDGWIVKMKSPSRSRDGVHNTAS